MTRWKSSRPTALSGAGKPQLVPAFTATCSYQGRPWSLVTKMLLAAAGEILCAAVQHDEAAVAKLVDVVLSLALISISPDDLDVVVLRIIADPVRLDLSRILLVFRRHADIFGGSPPPLMATPKLKARLHSAIQLKTQLRRSQLASCRDGLQDNNACTDDYTRAHSRRLGFATVNRYPIVESSIRECLIMERLLYLQLAAHRQSTSREAIVHHLQRGPGPMKRGDHGRRRTVGRIDRGDGDGGEPVRSPSCRPAN